MLKVVFVILSLNLAAAQADSIVITAADGVKWRVFYDAPVKVTFDATKKPNTTIDTLNMQVTRTDNEPITLKFQQEDKADTTGVKEGLRVNFEAQITNASGKDWLGNSLLLMDDAPAVAGLEDKQHPTWPHFHPNKADPQASFKPYVVDVNKLDDPAAVLVIQDGGTTKVEAGLNFEVANLLLHERHIAPEDLQSMDPGLRVFRLIEQPVLVLMKMEEARRSPSGLNDRLLTLDLSRKSPVPLFARFFPHCHLSFGGLFLRERWSDIGAATCDRKKTERHKFATARCFHFHLVS
ncbi:MAG: hypothetical protein L0Y72_02015 [Gemmataceae bacterium]|nr:hypothetical protein [Gemmataceae bacterium]MCI0737792.1 hypothetical protein [Gemmataceae bacterium]